MKVLSKTIFFLLISLVLLGQMANSAQINSFQVQLINRLHKGKIHSNNFEFGKKNIAEAIILFESYLDHMQGQKANSIQTIHRCSQSQRTACSDYSKDFLKRCLDDESEQCWKQFTHVYPKCFKCYCPFVAAKTCQATNFILWLAYKKSMNDGCSNLLQKECIPLLLGSYLQVQTCKWCKCLASKKGYETQADYCSIQLESIKHLLQCSKKDGKL